MLEGSEAFRSMAERISDEGYVIVEKGGKVPNDLRTDYMAADLAVVDAFSKVFASPQGFDAKQLGFMQALANALTAENTKVLSGLAFENLDAAAMLSDCGGRAPEESITAAVGAAGVQKGAGGTEAQAEAAGGSGGDEGERAGAIAFLRMLRAVRATPEIPMSDAVRAATQPRGDREPGLMMFDYGHADRAVAECLSAAGLAPRTAAARGLVKALGTHLMLELVGIEHADADDATEVESLLTAGGYRDPGLATETYAAAVDSHVPAVKRPAADSDAQASARAKHVLGLFLELQNEEWALAVALGNAIREECWNGSQHEDACPRLSLALSGMLEERLARMEDTLAIGGALGLSEAAVKELAYTRPR
jgi:hypothetical protein